MVHRNNNNHNMITTHPSIRWIEESPARRDVSQINIDFNNTQNSLSLFNRLTSIYSETNYLFVARNKRL